MAEGEEAGDAGLNTYDVATNGVSLSVTQQGEGPVVLFCHGFPDTSYTWRRLMKAIASAGYQAIAPDMRGDGRSSAPTDAGVEAAVPSISERPIEMRFIFRQEGHVPNEILDFTFIGAAAPKPTSPGGC